jgi:dihydroflavonol-4-reductase
MKILLTGASGFIGAHVAAELTRRGAQVRAFCRSEPPPEASVSDWATGDVRELDALKRAAAGCEAVVHTAAEYSYDRSEAQAMYDTNVVGTRNVIEAATEARIRRLLVTSSSATCGPVPGRPATEHDQPPAWELDVPYKRTKLLAERLALQAVGRGIEVVCVNPTTVVGPRDRKPTPSGKMIRDLVHGRIIGYVRGAGINVVSVDDVARGHALALERGRSGERYILGGDNLPLRNAFAFATQAIDRAQPWLALPWPAVYGAALAAERYGRLIGREPRLLVLDEVRLARTPLFFSSAKAVAELGYEPGPAADALAAAARWFESARQAGAKPSPLRGLGRLRPPVVRRPAGHSSS